MLKEKNKDMWKSWSEVKKICQGKKVIFWGCSDDWVPKTIKKFNNGKDVAYIVDKNPVYNGTSFLGIPAHLPDILKREKKENIYIIITAGAYESIRDSLEELGFEAGKNFCCTPEVKDWGLVQEIRNYDKNIIVSCADFKNKKEGKRFSKMGGGIYVCNTKENTFDKKIEGHFRQIIKVGDFYYIIEYVEKKIYILSKNFDYVDALPLDQSKGQREKPNYCGIDYYPEKDVFFVANAESDTINIYERKDFKLVDTINFSSKFQRYNQGQHHINDIAVVDDSLLVSCFSVSGNWKRGILDGGIVAYDINNIHKSFEVLIRDLWMPHSIKYFDGTICYLDSMRGELMVGSKRVEGRFPGFTRGLAYDGRFYYIGQSEVMYASRLLGVRDNIMCSAGFYLFDINTKISRFYSFPFIMGVHDLLVEDNK